jgi:hypothetical protein
MKKIFYILVLSCVLSSCNNKINDELPQQKQNEFFLQMQDRFEAAGVVNMIDNYSLKNEDNAMIRAGGAHLNFIKKFKVATQKIEYLDGSIVYSFQMPNNNFYVIKIHANEIIRDFSTTFKETERQLVFEVKEKDNLKSYFFDKNMKNMIIDNMQVRPLSAVDDPCAMLGPRRLGESFSDCFARNWNHFCCDFSGCLAQIFQAQLVAAAIALTCVC